MVAALYPVKHKGESVTVMATDCHRVLSPPLSSGAGRAHAHPLELGSLRHRSLKVTVCMCECARVCRELESVCVCVSVRFSILQRRSPDSDSYPGSFLRANFFFPSSPSTASATPKTPQLRVVCGAYTQPSRAPYSHIWLILPITPFTAIPHRTKCWLPEVTDAGAKRMCRSSTTGEIIS